MEYDFSFFRNRRQKNLRKKIATYDENQLSNFGL
jgi:hypothetical protein